jgi:hypothetical protein
VAPAPAGKLVIDTLGAVPLEVRGYLRRSAPDTRRTSVRVFLTRENWGRAVNIDDDDFEFSPVRPGRYELRIASLGQPARVDSVDVPPEGLTVIVPFERTDALDGCSGPNVTGREKP